MRGTFPLCMGENHNHVCGRDMAFTVHGIQRRARDSAVPLLGDGFRDVRIYVGGVSVAAPQFASERECACRGNVHIVRLGVGRPGSEGHCSRRWSLPGEVQDCEIGPTTVIHAAAAALPRVRLIPRASTQRSRPIRRCAAQPDSHIAPPAGARRGRRAARPRGSTTTAARFWPRSRDRPRRRSIPTARG